MGAAGIFGIVGAAEGTVGTIIANLAGDKTRNELLKLKGLDPKYTTNPYATKRMGLAGNFLNARTPGAATMENNIYGNQAQMMNNINQNATDGSQALAMGAQANAQTNKAFSNLGMYEDQNYMDRLQNWNGAAMGMVNEGDKLHADEIRQWQDKVNITMARNAIRQQQGSNMVENGKQWASVGGLGGGGGGAAGGMGGK